MAPFLLAVFLSAFLLFQVQPLIGRYILPWYGGSPAVWTACMMFFQLALLAGYFYAHLLASKVPVKRQPQLHIGLLMVSLIFLPIGPPESWTPDSSGQPALDILLLLGMAISIPFILLSASAPLLQHWFYGAYQNKSPFRLYALSNIGSLAALLTYPIMFEPQFSLDTQATIWSIGYLLLIPAFILCGLAFARQNVDQITVEPEISAQPKASLADRLLWVGLAACGATLLLAMTNQISQDIAVIPFLWILPLSLYLLSFIICFAKDAWYHRGIWIPLLCISLGLLLYIMFDEFTNDSQSIQIQIGIYSLALFACCMVCHGELVRRRAAASHLTTFYLYVALGGALGGFFVNLIAPILFTGFWEMHTGLTGTVVLAGICIFSDPHLKTRRSVRLAFSAIWSVGVIGLATMLVTQIQTGRKDSIEVDRSFFGVTYVDEWSVGKTDHARSLYHGRILHGRQYMHPAYQRLASTYYGGSTGVGVAIKNHPRQNTSDPNYSGLNIGVIGLGIGTLSTLGNGMDSFRYYEINPRIEDIARKHFKYLENSLSSNEVIIGDARVTLQRELDETGANNFDVLVLDAFSSDAIPVHLLTTEAFDLYQNHLRADGIIVVHITNHHINLRPVVRTAARLMDMQAIWVSGEAERWYQNRNDWIILTRNEAFLNLEKLASIRSDWLETELKPVIWTDDFSNLLEVIEWRD